MEPHLAFHVNHGASGWKTRLKSPEKQPATWIPGCRDTKPVPLAKPVLPALCSMHAPSWFAFFEAFSTAVPVVHRTFASGGVKCTHFVAICERQLTAGWQH